MLHNAPLLLTGLTSECCTGMCIAVPERLQPNPRTRGIEMLAHHVHACKRTDCSVRAGFDAQIDHHIQLAQQHQAFLMPL